MGGLQLVQFQVAEPERQPYQHVEQFRYPSLRLQTEHGLYIEFR